MKGLINWFNKKFPSNQWEMDVNHKVEWKTDYGSGDQFARELEKELNTFGKKVSIFLRAIEVQSISIAFFVKSKFGISSNTDYLAKLTYLLEDEVECYLLDAEANKDMKGEYANVKFLGSRYNPNYNHEAYIAAAKERSIYKKRL